MKRGYIRGVITCDPSWRGLAFTIHVPSFFYNESVVYDLQSLNLCKKPITQPLVYIPLIAQTIDKLIIDKPYINLCDKLIMESQFTDNMRQLSYVIMTALQTRLLGLVVEYCSALTCKRKNGVAYGESHHQNKKNMYEYVNNNKHTLIAGDTLLDHNTADSIIILNTWLNLKKRHLYASPEEYTESNMETYMDVPFELKNTKFICPICGYHTGRVYLCKKMGSTQYGKFFVSCRAFAKTSRKCGACTFFSTIPPVIKNDKIGDKMVGEWKKGDGSHLPPDTDTIQAMYPDAVNTIPVTPLKKADKRKRAQSEEDEDQVDEFNDSPPPKRHATNPLNDLVEALEKKQDSLREEMLERQLKTDNMMEKLMLAITGQMTTTPHTPAPAPSTPLTPEQPTKEPALEARTDAEEPAVQFIAPPPIKFTRRSSKKSK